MASNNYESLEDRVEVATKRVWVLWILTAVAVLVASSWAGEYILRERAIANILTRLDQISTTPSKRPLYFTACDGFWLVRDLRKLGVSVPEQAFEQRCRDGLYPPP